MCRTYFFLFSYSSAVFKAMIIVNDDSRVVNKLETSLTDDARVVICDHCMFYSTGHKCHWWDSNP